MANFTDDKQVSNEGSLTVACAENNSDEKNEKSWDQGRNYPS